MRGQQFIQWMLNKMNGEPFEVAEIGVKRGRTSVSLLENMPNMTSLLMVDIWEYGNDDEQITRERVVQFEGRGILCKNNAVEMIVLEVDFAMVDVGIKPTVLLDILNLWWPHCEHGIMGRHYLREGVLQRNVGRRVIKEVVDRFCMDNKLTLTLQVDGPGWWIRKGREQ